MAIGPDFQTIADTRNDDDRSSRLSADAHPKMPNLILTPEQSAEVIAFVLSLRARRQPE